MQSLFAWLAGFILLMLTGGAISLQGQEVGDQVVAKARVELRSQNTTKAFVAAETILDIEAVQGDWLWVKSPSGKKGWVFHTDVILKKKEAAPVDRATLEVKYDVLANTDVIPGELIVTVHKDVKREDLAKALKSLRHEATIVDQIASANTYLVKVPADVMHECRLRLGIHPYVETCGLNTIRELSKTYDDPALQADDEHGWNLRRINVADAWDITTGGKPIAIVDSGIKADHVEFRGKLTDPFSVYTKSSKMQTGLVTVRRRDEFITMHGTHVAGTAAGAAGNGEGTAGVAPDCPIMPIQSLTYMPKSKGIFGLDWATVQGLNRAIDQGAKVINYSIGGPPPAEMLNAWLTASDDQSKSAAEAQILRWVKRSLNDDYLGVLDRAERKGVIIVKSAGNDDLPAKFDPLSSSRRVISVAATNKKDGRAIFNEVGASNYGDYTTVSAPGQEIWNASADPDAPYASMQGTSMAAPHVAGLIGLMKTIDPELSRKEAAEILIATGTKLKTDKPIGPLINAAAALTELKRRRDESVARPEPDPPLIDERPNPADPTLPDDGVAIIGGPRPWRNPNVRRLIDLWLSIALPRIGDRNPRNGPFFFDRFGRVISIRVVYTILPPDFAADRYQWLWTNARDLDSSNFGTLNIFAINMMRSGVFNPAPPAIDDQVADVDDPVGDASKNDGSYSWSSGVYTAFFTGFDWKQTGKDTANVTFKMDGRLSSLLRKHGLPETVAAQVKRTGDKYVMVGDPLGSACSAAVTRFEKSQNNPKSFNYKFKIAFTPKDGNIGVQLDAVANDAAGTGSFPGTAKRK